MEKDLGNRRIQRIGLGSYSISLPKEWVEGTGLEKGNEVALRAHDLSLIIAPRGINETKQLAENNCRKEYFVIVGPTDNTQSVVRKINALYVVGADLIHVRFENGVSYEKHKVAISGVIKNDLLGSEIVYESGDEIAIKTLVSHFKFPIERAIRRLAWIALSMNKDTVLAATKMDKDMLHRVVYAHYETKRLDLYIIRRLKLGIERNLLEELGFETPKEYLGYRIATNIIKGIADYAVNIANDTLAFETQIGTQIDSQKEPIDEDLLSAVFEFNSKARESFEDSLTALLKRDYKEADKILSESPRDLVENSILKALFDKRKDPRVFSIIKPIFDSSRRIMECGRDIAEVALNRTVERNVALARA